MSPINMIRLDATAGKDGKIDPEKGSTLTVTSPSGQTVYELDRKQTALILAAVAGGINVLSPKMVKNDLDPSFGVREVSAGG